MQQTDVQQSKSNLCSAISEFNFHWCKCSNHFVHADVYLRKPLRQSVAYQILLDSAAACMLNYFVKSSDCEMSAQITKGHLDIFNESLN